MTLDRRLCDDGACIGVLAPDGVCAVCGLKAKPQKGGGPSKDAERAGTRSSPSAFPSLVVIFGTDLGRRYELRDSSTVIGRSSKCGICIDQESISRSHVKIDKVGRTVRLQSLGSSNGTYVNDEPVEEYLLRDGDLIKIGRTILKFLSAGNIENSYHDEMYQRASERRFCENGPCVGVLDPDGKCPICGAFADTQVPSVKG